MAVRAIATGDPSAGGEVRPPLTERRPLLLALGLLLLALAVRLPAIDRSLWLDECFSMDMAAQPPADLPRLLRERDTHPPGYYLALGAWLELSPSTRSGADGSARVFSLLTNLLHVLLLGLVARRLLGARAGWVTAALAAVSGELAWPGTEVRSFALAALLLTLAWLIALEALERGRAWRYALSAVPLAAACWTFYYAVLGAFALVAFFLVLRPPVRRLLALLAAWAAAGLTVLPWLPSLRVQASWVLERSAASAARLSFDEPAQLLDRWVHQHLVVLGPWFWLGGLLALAPLLIAWRQRVAWGWRWQPAPAERPRAFAALGALALAYLLAVLLAGLAGSFVGRRYATFLAGAWCVVAAGLHARLSPRIQRWVLALLLVGGAVGTLGRSLWPKHCDWRGATAWVEAQASDGELVGVEPTFEILCWRHYAEAGGPPAAGLPGELPRLAGDASSQRNVAYVEADHAAALTTWLRLREGLWLLRVEGRSRPREDALAGALEAGGWRRARTRAFTGLAIEHWVRLPR